MSTQQHGQERQLKARAPAPVKEQRWLVALCSILGVTLPLAVGWEMQWPFFIVVNLPANDWFLPMAVWVMVPVAVGACFLSFAFRTWWVAVFAGVAWIVGEFLSFVIRPLVEGGRPMLELQGGILGVASVPLIIGMALGVGMALPLVFWRERGHSRQ